MNIGIQKGFRVGLATGGLFGTIFLSYALGFWYGGTLVAESMDKGCGPTELSNTCVTGGNVIATFFCIIMGSFSLGQAAPSISAFFSAKAACAPMMEVIKRNPLINGLSEEGIKVEHITLCSNL